jgi:hypothetical protein
MNIPNHGYRRLDMNDIALFHEQLFSLGTDGFDHRFSKKLFAVKSLDALIQVDTGCCEVSNCLPKLGGAGAGVPAGCSAQHTRKTRHSEKIKWNRLNECNFAPVENFEGIRE